MKNRNSQKSVKSIRLMGEGVCGGKDLWTSNCRWLAVKWWANVKDRRYEVQTNKRNLEIVEQNIEALDQWIGARSDTVVGSVLKWAVPSCHMIATWPGKYRILLNNEGTYRNLNSCSPIKLLGRHAHSPKFTPVEGRLWLMKWISYFLDVTALSSAQKHTMTFNICYCCIKIRPPLWRCWQGEIFVRIPVYLSYPLSSAWYSNCHTA